MPKCQWLKASEAAAKPAKSSFSAGLAEQRKIFVDEHVTSARLALTTAQPRLVLWA
jgi:hypothetical protein